MLNFITLMDRLERKFQLRLGEKEIKASAVATMPVPLLFESYVLEPLKLRLQWAAGLQTQHLPSWFYPKTPNIS